MPDGPRDEDWDAVARVIQDRLTETRTTQMDIAARAGVSLTTLRELQHNLNPRRRRPQTLAAVSEALGWPAGYLGQLLRGEAAEPLAEDPRDVDHDDPVLAELDAVKADLHAIVERLDAIERRLGPEDASS